MEEEHTIKTHWLQTPNKNYLGHWDLPNGQDLILTIKSAQWEEVKNPIINVSEAKRVLRFEEKNVKPFICNETNAQSILRSTATKYMEDSVGLKIKLYQSQVKVKGEQVDCLRIKEVPQSAFEVKYVSEEQVGILQNLMISADKDVQEICGIMKVDSLSKIPLSRYNAMCKRLQEIVNENN